MKDTESRVGVVAHFFRRGNGDTHLFSLTVINEGRTRDGRLYIGRNEYDVEWSRNYGCYLFNQSGGGGGSVIPVRGLFFCSGDVQLERKPSEWVSGKDRPPWSGRKTRLIRARNPTRRMMRPPRHIDIAPGQDIFDWLESNGVEQDAVWCRECNDWVRGDYLCEHCWWCNKIGWYSTPSERCGHSDPETECCE